MAQTELNPLPAIVAQIKLLCAQGRTGTVFLVSDKSHMAQVHLIRGEVVLLLHRNRRALDALKIIGGMQKARLRFDEVYVCTTEKDNLSTREVLDYLDAVALQADVPGTTSTPLAPSAQSIVLTAEVKSAIEQIMVKYIGPMAQIVCADHFEQATDLRALAQGLATEIPGQEQAARFRAEIAAALNLAPV